MPKRIAKWARSERVWIYFSSQRGPDGRGLTYEVRGPFRSLRRHALERRPA